MTNFPNAPRPSNLISIRSLSLWSLLLLLILLLLFLVHKFRPTRSSGDRVDATPSWSNRTLTIRSSADHHNFFASMTVSPGTTVVADDASTTSPAVAAAAAIAAPSGVKLSGTTRSNWNGNANVGCWENLAAKTGGGFPRVPDKIAAGTLSGVFGLAVTYNAAPGLDDGDVAVGLMTVPDKMIVFVNVVVVGVVVGVVVDSGWETMDLEAEAAVAAAAALLSKEDTKLFEVHTPPTTIMDNHKDLSTAGGVRKVLDDDDDDVVALREETFLLCIGLQLLLLLSLSLRILLPIVVVVVVVVVTVVSQAADCGVGRVKLGR